MATLDSLSRSDLLKTLKNMVDLHSTISGNQSAMQEANNKISNAYADYQRRLNASKKSGKRIVGIILLCILGFNGLPSIVLIFFSLAFSSFHTESPSGLSDALNDGSFKGIIDSPQLVNIVVLSIIVVTAIVSSIYLIIKGNKESKKKNEEFLKSGFGESVNAFIEEQKLSIQNYNRAINEATRALNNYYREYCVHQDLRSSTALRFCYNEIYSSATMGINTAHQHFIQAAHRENMATLQRQQNEATERARQQAHADSLSQQHLDRQMAEDIKIIKKNLSQ